MVNFAQNIIAVINLGQYNHLTAVEKTKAGWIMKDEEGTEALLPNRELIDIEIEVDESHELYIYKGKEEGFLATFSKADACAEEFAYLQVDEVTTFGAFLDLGIPKQVLVPFRQMEFDMVEDGWYLVYLYVDRVSDRLTASSKVEQFLVEDTSELTEGQEVEIIIRDETKLGFNVIVNHKYRGLLYHNEVFSELFLGDKTKGFISKIREDGKLDIKLRQHSHQFIDKDAQVILEKLKHHDGQIALNDKSAPEKIYEMFEISKKAFKKAIGSLYKQRLISIEEDGIKLLEKEEENPSSTPETKSFRRFTRPGE